MDRINADYAMQATVMHQVMTTAVASFGKQGRSAAEDLKKFIEGLLDNG